MDEKNVDDAVDHVDVKNQNQEKDNDQSNQDEEEFWLYVGLLGK